MAYSDIQSAFTSGELSPNLFARVDLDKYAAGAALMRNFFADFRGGASNRPGTRFISFTADPQNATPQRLIPFIVDSSTGYVLEFGNLYVNAWFQGVLEATVTTPYVAADIALLKFAQSADVMTITHPSYPPAELSRNSLTSFSYSVIAVGTQMPSPQFTAATGKYTPGNYFSYAVTAVSLDGKEESLSSVPIIVESNSPLSGDDNHVIDLTWSWPGEPIAYYNVFKYGPIDRSDPITSLWGFIGSTLAPSFVDNGIVPDFSKTPPTNVDPWSGGQLTSISVNNPGSGYTYGTYPSLSYLPLTISGGGGTGAAGYAIINNGTNTCIGAYLTNPGKNYSSAPSITATGAGGSGATFNSTVSDIHPKYPVCVSYYDQRRVFGGGTYSPENLDFSQPGNYNNFNRSQIAQASDAINVSLSAREVNTVVSMVPMSTGLVTFTTGGSFLISAGATGAALTASNITAKYQASVGASNVTPLIINYDILYVENKGSIVRDLAFNYYLQSYQGSDRSMLANHLFFNHTIDYWAWSEVPFKLVWCIRDDGIALSLTYVPDQEIYAWARHDTQGEFLSVCVVPEGEINAVYFIVNRLLQGYSGGTPCNSWYQCIERLDDRMYNDVEEAWFVDCGLSYPKTFPDVEAFAYYTDNTKSLVHVCTTPITGPTETYLVQSTLGVENFFMFDVALDPSYTGTLNVKVNGQILNNDSAVNYGMEMYGIQYNGGSALGIPQITISGSLCWDPGPGGVIDFFMTREISDPTTITRDWWAYGYGGYPPSGPYRQMFNNAQFYQFTTLTTDMVFSIPNTSQDSGYYAAPFGSFGVSGMQYPDNIGGGTLEATPGNFQSGVYTVNGSGMLSGPVLGPYYNKYNAGYGGYASVPAGGAIATTAPPSDATTTGYGGRTKGSATLAAGSTVTMVCTWQPYYYSTTPQNQRIYSIEADSGAGYVNIPLTNVYTTVFGPERNPIGTTPKITEVYLQTSSSTLPGPFESVSIGNIIHIAGGKVQITNIIDSNTIEGIPLLPLLDLIPNDPSGLVALPQQPGTWDIAVPTNFLSGLSHLEGKEVVALADGEVVSGLTVSGGSVTLPRYATNIVVGLSYTCQLQTLYLDISGGAGTVQGKRKFLPAVTLRLDQTRGLYVGPSFDNMVPVQDVMAPIQTPTPLITGDVRTIIPGDWNTPAEVYIQTTDPLPASVLGVIAEVVEGDTGR